MAQKNASIDDIKRPEKVTPSATSRPILVSGQTKPQEDPMMVTSGGDKPDGVAVQSMSHSAKTITPLSEVTEDGSTDETPKPVIADTASQDNLESSPQSSDNPAESREAKLVDSKSEEGTAVTHSGFTGSSDATERDSDAAQSAEEAAVAEAKEKREQALEELIVSGKFAVPINAVQRRRSRMHSVVLCLIAVLLAAALLDLVADVGIIDLPSGIPHSNFFSAH